MEFSAAFSILLSLFTIGNVIIALLFLFFLNFLWILYDFRGMPPGPRYSSLPFIGNFFSFDSEGKGFEGQTVSLKKKYGKVFAIKLGSFKFVVGGTSEAIKEALVKRSADYAGRAPFYSTIVNTLGGKDIAFGNYGPAWKLHRKLFSSALRQYLTDLPLIESRVGEQSQKVLKFIDEQDGKPFDPSYVLAKSVVDVICGITFGRYFNSSHPQFDRFFELTIKLLSDQDLNDALITLDFFPIAKYFPFQAYKANQEMTDETLIVLRQVFRQREKDFDISDPVDDLITGLLKARHEAECEDEEEKQVLLSEDYMINTLNDMFSAGYDTTSVTLRWALVFLVNNPQYQNEIQEALDEVVGRDKMPGLDNRSQLPIIQATILETLRLGSTTSTTIPHYTLTDTTLCGYRVPKDTVVLLDLVEMHKDPSNWENPDVFDPHRHLDSDGQLAKQSVNLLPFSAGRRVCAGESLAKVQLFLFLSCMLQKFTFVAEEGKFPMPLDWTEGGVTRSPISYKIRAIKRQKFMSDDYYHSLQIITVSSRTEKSSKLTKCKTEP